MVTGAGAALEAGQGLGRAMRILRVIASQGRRGMPFKAIATGAQLPPSTVHRLLKALLAEGLVHKDARTAKFHLGHLLYELGLLALPQFHLRPWCQEALDRLAALTQDTVYLSERIGLEAVATDFRDGDYPLKALSLHVGVRRPLGVGTGGVAMLAALPPPEAEAIVRENAAYLPALGNLDEAFLLQAIAAARQAGYAYLQDKATRGMAAVAVAVQDRATGSLGAISVAAVPARMADGRAAQIAQALRKEAEGVEARIAAAAPAGAAP